MNNKKIAWQKYEDVITEQINSPFLMELFDSIVDSEIKSQEEQEYQEEYVEYEDQYEQEEEHGLIMPISIPPSLSKEISIMSNFDCWMGYTNFQITNSIKKQISKIEGVGALRVCGRYRFVLGVGKMFKMRDIRIQFENKIIQGK